MKESVFLFFLNVKTNLYQIFSQGLGENTSSLQTALKSNAPGVKVVGYIYETKV